MQLAGSSSLGLFSCPYSPECVEKLSDNSRKASLWTPKRGQNGARGVVSSPLVASIAGVHGSSYDLSDSFWKGNSPKFAYLPRGSASASIGAGGLARRRGRPPT